MRVTFYGKLADRLKRTVDIDGPARTVGEVRARLAERFPDSRDDLLAPSLKACIKDLIVGNDHPVARDTLIEFFPPVSGG